MDSQTNVVVGRNVPWFVRLVIVRTNTKRNHFLFHPRILIHD